MKAKSQRSLKKGVSRETGKMEYCGGAPCFSENLHGNRFMDLNSAGRKPENRAERQSVLASGDKDKILKYYTELYYGRLARS